MKVEGLINLLINIFFNIKMSGSAFKNRKNKKRTTLSDMFNHYDSQSFKQYSLSMLDSTLNIVIATPNQYDNNYWQQS
jgi:hypothetical protein